MLNYSQKLCSITIAELLAKQEWSVPLGKTCRDYHSRLKGCCLISFWHEQKLASLASIWKSNLAVFQRFFRFSFLSLDYRTTYFSSPFPFSSWRPKFDAFYNCFRSNLNLFDRYGTLSTIFTLRLSWFIDVNLIFIAVTQFEWIDRVRTSSVQAKAALLRLSLSWRNQCFSRIRCISLQTTSVKNSEKKFRCSATVQQISELSLLYRQSTVIIKYHLKIK